MMPHPRRTPHSISRVNSRQVFVSSSLARRVPLIAALTALGDDHVLFSIDYPYEDSGVARCFIETAGISGAVRDKVGRLNAVSLMRLPA